MTNLHPITLTAALPAIERDLAERRSAAATFGPINALRAVTIRVARPALRRFAPRLVGAA
ncbi:MAG: hypothetical protein EA416_17390 [Trueperaceae bacterium]|nr:MAG: hypothetical protein EA416_17390 [Trueperaceae bacterium]